MRPSLYLSGKRGLRAVCQLAWITTASAIILVAGVLPASASTVSRSSPVGMRHAANAAAHPVEFSATKDSYHSCDRIEYKGNAGYIAVQERKHRLQWSIVMTPLKYSIRKWDIDTYLSGKKTSSGFHRTVTTPYVPHGSLAVPADKVFHVQAKVVGRYGTFESVPNAWRT